MRKKAHLIFSNVILTVIHPNKSPTIPNIRYASWVPPPMEHYAMDMMAKSTREKKVPFRKKFRFPLSPTRTTKISSARSSVAEQQRYPFHPMQRKLLLYYAEMYMSHQQNTAPPNKSPILRNRNAIFTFLRTEEVLFTLPKETDYGRFIKPV